MKKFIMRILNKMPYVRRLYAYSLNSAYPNGHYYSPVFSIEDLKTRQQEVWPENFDNNIRGIDLNSDFQLELLKKFESLEKHNPFTFEKIETNRYYYNNNFYNINDGVILYSMIHWLKPKQIIEIGSGFSSALMLDVNDQFFSSKINLTFIEPNPERLFSQFNDTDKSQTKVIEGLVQKVPLQEFEKLKSGDILFVDSTHVTKTGSDVNYILFEVLPRLNSGVVIHFHDIFFPFEYPKEWVFKGWNWNEAYILKAFLMHNQDYEILYFADYVKTCFPEKLEQLNTLTGYKMWPGSNIWLRKK